MSENKKELNQENLDQVSGGLYGIPEGGEKEKELDPESINNKNVVSKWNGKR